MEEIIERIQDEIFLIFMLLGSFSIFMYLVTEKLSFISSFLSLTVSLIAINKEVYKLYIIIFILISIISFIIMLDLDMWIEMKFFKMNNIQRIIRGFISIMIFIPILQIFSKYSFFRTFRWELKPILLSFLSIIFIILSLVIIPRYILIFISRLASHKKVTSFLIMKISRQRKLGMTISELHVRDGINEYSFELSNRAYNILKEKTYVKIQMVRGHFGSNYVKNNFLGRDRLRTLKYDLPRFILTLAIVFLLTVLFIIFLHVVNNYAWIG